MTLNKKKIGSLIKFIDCRNINIKTKNLLGMNINKEFMPSIANTSGADLSKYKIIEKGQFAYSPMQTGRDETIRISLYKFDKPAIISPAYSVFEIKDENIILPEFFMMWFLRPESDRYGWFISDSSVRASLDLDRFSDIEIPIPSLEIQKKYVLLFNSILKNQITIRDSLDDLQLICELFINDQIKNNKTYKLGDYIEAIHETNEEKNIQNVRGISSVFKKFIKPKGNMNGVDISDYKIVRKNHFSYNPNTARMGDRIPIALNKSEDCVVSKIYPVFFIKNVNFLLPEFLYLWFKRSEFDRYARYHSWGSARETFDWSDMCEVKLPIPSIEKQKSIVLIHDILEKRIVISDKLKKLLKPLCPVIMQDVLNNYTNNLI